MRITTVRSDGLAALSYFVSSENEAIVIDPRRDASIYHDLAKESETKIRYIFETHRNEDLVTGSLELQSYQSNAEIGHSKATKFGFGEHDISDGEVFKVGQMQITCLSTPGHTDDSICYAVADTSVSSYPIVVFTGDTLFVNEVGRTDLVDIKKHAEMSKKLYTSLHENLLPLGDDVIIHPAHGAGSVCGGDIGDREFSTIGYERKHNPWLSMDENEFVKAKVNQQLTLSPYFKRCEKLNTDGPALLSTLDPISGLSIDEFEKLIEQPEHRAIDTRSKYEFLDGHVPKSISMSLGNIGLLAGWALRSSQSFSFILPDSNFISQATAPLYRVGLDNIIGYLEGGYDSWVKSGKAVSSIPALSAKDLHSQIQTKTITLVDVREEHEFHKERIKGSQSFPLTSLEEDISKDPSLQDIVTICPSGFRSTTAASIFEHHGASGVAVLVDGLKEWKGQGYTLEGN